MQFLSQTHSYIKTHAKSYVKRHAKSQVVLKSLTTAVLLSLLLTNCTSKPKAPKSQPPVASVQAVKSADVAITAAQYLTRARASAKAQALPLLVNAAQQFLAQQNYRKALWLAHQTQPLLTNPLRQYELALVQADALQQMQYPHRAFEQLEVANDIVKQQSIRHQRAYFELLTAIEQSRQRQVASLAAQMTVFSLNPQSTNDDVFVLWQQLSQLSQWQVKQLVQMAPPYVRGWQQLLRFAHQFGANAQQFRRYLSQWQRLFPNHPGNALLDSLALPGPDQAPSITNIAVMLPLSGRQAAAGNALQQGILSAYGNDDGKTLHFIDSQQVDMSSLQQSFAQLAIDAVIGPLLKPTVAAYLAQQELTVPTLLLNVPDNIALKPHQVALSMRPEDEAIQAATRLSRFDYQHPIVLSYQDQVSLRIAKTFADQWHRLTGNSIEIMSFEQGRKMKDNLQQSLEVSASKQRIRSLKRRIKQILETETRNRRDIDMIYLVGSAQQTRLLKPYIDVNISQFAELIPVYASSRSHSAKHDGSAQRDLSGLTFTAMPWLLNSKQQNKQLAQLSHKLWPQRSDSLQGLFAMGIDSLALIEKIPKMQRDAYVRHFGQTGVLKLNPDNILTRSLIWGQYEKDKVAQISMD